jgi:hypothetical protein
MFPFFIKLLRNLSLVLDTLIPEVTHLFNFILKEELTQFY